MVGYRCLIPMHQRAWKSRERDQPGERERGSIGSRMNGTPVSS